MKTENEIIWSAASLIAYQEWDSSFFNLNIGKIVLKFASTAHIQQIIDYQKNSGYDLIYLFVRELDEKTNSWLRKIGHHPIDIKLTYRKTIKDSIPSDYQKVEKYLGNLTNELLQLTFQSGHKSRFKKDSKLNDRFKDMYRVWIEKSITRELADVVLVFYNNDQIGGFITVRINKQQAVIGLIAVDPKLRGKGIGTGLLKAAENWSVEQGCNILSVSTQSENTDACKLYLRNGFTEYSSQFIFHLHGN